MRASRSRSLAWLPSVPFYHRDRRRRSPELSASAPAPDKFLRSRRQVYIAFNSCHQVWTPDSEHCKIRVLRMGNGLVHRPLRGCKRTLDQALDGKTPLGRRRTGPEVRYRQQMRSGVPDFANRRDGSILHPGCTLYRVPAPKQCSPTGCKCKELPQLAFVYDAASLRHGKVLRNQGNALQTGLHRIAFVARLLYTPACLR